MTTNWDDIVESAAQSTLRDITAFYLHGRADNPDCLYLPTEIVEEPYRTVHERRQLNNARAQAVGAITGATKLVVYGLAISPLDVELGAQVYAALHESTVKEIHVIDPDHAQVVERVATLGVAGSPSLPIYSRHPSNFSDVCRFPSE